MSISCRYLNPSWRTNCASLVPGNTVCIPSPKTVIPSTNGGNGANSNNAATPAAPKVYQPPFSPSNLAGCSNQYTTVLGDSCMSLWKANNIDQAVFVAVRFAALVPEVKFAYKVFVPSCLKVLFAWRR